MSSAAFAARQRAAEGQYFNTEAQQAVMRHLEKLVQQGKMDAASLAAAQRSAEATAASGLPTQVVTSRREYVYNHTPGLLPARRWDDKRYVQLGTKVSMGRMRWETEGVSIFSVSDGKRLASTPAPQYGAYEAARLGRLERAAYESPTMAGIRLLPKFTPGRAFLWGTVLALWGTGAVVATAARQLDIRTAEDAPGVLRPLFGGMGAALEAWFAPLRASMSINAVAGETLRTDTQQSELVRRLRTTLFTGSA